MKLVPVKTLLGCLVVALVLGSALRIGAESEGKNLQPRSGVREPANAGPRRIPRNIRTDVFSSTDVPKAIPENDETGISSTIEVPIPYPSKVTDVNLVLDSLPHTCVADLQIELEHLILSHHGSRDRGSPVVPMTIEAFILAAADELDARLHQVRRHVADDDTDGPFTAYSKRLERVLLKPSRS